MIRLDPRFAGPDHEQVRRLVRDSDLVKSVSGDTTFEQANDGIIVKNFQVISPDGIVRESYPELYVDRNIVRNGDGSQVNNKPYNWITHFQQENGFLPSMALSCNLLAYMFEHKDDFSQLQEMLLTYKDKGNGFGYHCQNGWLIMVQTR